MKLSVWTFLTFCLLVSLPATHLFAADFYVGSASGDMTPDRPCALQGQHYTRVARKADTPLSVSAVAIESREGEKSLDAAIIVSFDLCGIGSPLGTMIREAVRKELPDFNVDKLVMAVTHTHSSIAHTDGGYKVTDPDVMTAEEGRKFIVERSVPVIVKAWKSRDKGKFAYGLGQAVVASNRRMSYAKGPTVMYGKTNREDFRAIEGVEDHDLGLMCFYDKNDKLLAMLVNVSCPSQNHMHSLTFDADYWGPVRQALCSKYGKDLCVVPLCGAAGDMETIVLWRAAAEKRMEKLRGNNRLSELARRIIVAVDDVYSAVHSTRTDQVRVVTLKKDFSVPMMKITKEKYESSKRTVEAFREKLEKATPKEAERLYTRFNYLKRPVDRYEMQQSGKIPTRDLFVHVVRIGDTVLCTNPFELFTDYGIQIKARSKAVQTFVVQLADRPAENAATGYLPTKRAVARGGYGAVPESCPIGPEGGEILVEETLKLIDSAWK